MDDETLERERVIFDDLPSIPSALNNAGTFMDAIGYHEQAEIQYKRAISFTIGMFGSDKLDLAKRLNNLAGHYVRRSKYFEALPLSREAVKTGEKNYRHSPEHPDLLVWLANLANLYFDMERYADAEPLYKRVLSVRDVIPPADNPDLITTARERYTIILDQLGRGERTTKPGARVNRAGPAVGGANPSRSPKVGRNAPCPCGSGRKFKRCHGAG